MADEKTGSGILPWVVVGVSSVAVFAAVVTGAVVLAQGAPPWERREAIFHGVMIGLALASLAAVFISSIFD